MSSPTLTASRDFESQAHTHRKHASPCLPGWTAYPQLPQADEQLPAFHRKHDCLLYDTPPATRPGGAYIMVLASAAVITALVIGLSLVTLQFRRTSRSHTQIDQARIYAELGIRHALRFPATVPNWRQLLNSGVWLQDIPVDQAIYTVEGIDPIDGDLANNTSDPVVLISTATVGGVSRTVQVVAVENKTPIELLKYALAAQGDLTISNKSVVTGNITSNDDIDKSGKSSWVYGNAEAVGTISDSDNNITGVISPGSAPKEFPDFATILQYYRSVATDIPFQATIENVLLSPTSNPFGPTNPHGVYRIDGGGTSIIIQNCRIVGTLILENCGSNSLIQLAINWQPARPDYPALICNQPINFATTENLDEVTLNTDFSLPTEPGYGTVGGMYPNRIAGTIYVDEDVFILNKAHLVGTVITTSYCEVSRSATVDWDPAVLDNPPVGFYETRFSPVLGTWQQRLP